MSEILLYGEIGSDVMPADIKTQLSDADPSEELVVRIDSNGGSVFHGFSIHEAFSQYAGPKKAIVESAAFSIASYILTAFDNVEIAGNGYVMVHNPAMVSDGDDEDHAKVAQNLAKFKDSMVEGYAEKTGRSPVEITVMLAEETYLNATEAKEMGIVDRIMDRSIPSHAEAVLNQKNQLPYRVCASLFSGGQVGDIPKAEEKPMAEDKKPVAATVSEIKSAFPKASSDFIVRCLERQLPIASIASEAAAELLAENDKLLAQISSMKAEAEASKVAADAKAQEEDEEMEATAKATGSQPLAVAKGTPTATATQQWADAVNKYLDKGIERSRAVSMANKHNPGVRAAMLQEVNG